MPIVFEIETEKDLEITEENLIYCNQKLQEWKKEIKLIQKEIRKWKKEKKQD